MHRKASNDAFVACYFLDLALLFWWVRRMRLFSTFDALKVITRRGRIGTSSPVFGLRPIRSFF